MIKLDDNLLTELGLQSLPAEEKKALLRQIYETLEMRVGTTLARQMTDAQLDEFESFINNNDEAGALHWLETNFPNYKDVVAQEFEMLKGEIRQAVPQILANAAAAAQPQLQQQPMQQPQPQQMSAQPQQAPQYPQPVMPQQQPQAPAQPQPMDPSQAYGSQPQVAAPQQQMYQQQPMQQPYAAPQPPQQPYYQQQPPVDPSQYGPAA